MKTNLALLPHEEKERGWINCSKIYDWSDL